MSLSLLLGGSIAPLLLALTPASFLLARDCLEWEPAAKAVQAQAEKPCTRRRPPLLLM